MCEDASTQSSALHPDNKIIHGQRKPQCIHYAKMPPCGFMTPSWASFQGTAARSPNHMHC